MLSFAVGLLLTQTPSPVLKQFNEACVKMWPDLEATRALAKKNGWKARKVASAENLASGNWSEDFEISSTRTLKLHADDKRPSCSITFGDEAVPSKDFVAALEKEISGAKRDAAVEENWNKVAMSGTGTSSLVWRPAKQKAAMLSALVKKGDLAFEVFIGHPFYVGAKSEP